MLNNFKNCPICHKQPKELNNGDFSSCEDIYGNQHFVTAMLGKTRYEQINLDGYMLVFKEYSIEIWRNDCDSLSNFSSKYRFVCNIKAALSFEQLNNIEYISELVQNHQILE